MKHLMTRVVIGASFLALIAVVSLARPAQAAFPGNTDAGRVAFEAAGIIYTVPSDGSYSLTEGSPTPVAPHKLTTGHGPRWSPNGAQIVFFRGGDIWAMKADATNIHRVTKGTANDYTPDWSADGKQIVFARTTSADRRGTLFVVAATGGTPHRLTTADDGCASEPTWSAAGRYIVYWDKCSYGPPGGGYALDKVDTRTGAVSDIVGPTGVTATEPRTGVSETWNFGGTGPDVTPDGTRVLFKVEGDDPRCTPQDGCEPWSGVVETDLFGGGLRWVVDPDVDAFRSDDPAVSPTGEFFVYVGGNENPQLPVLPLSRFPYCPNGEGSTCSSLLYESMFGPSVGYPARPDWRPLNV
jgi:hypothetical protein